MDDVQKAHSIFRDEVTAVAWSFFVWKSINRVATQNKGIHARLNKNSLSWNTITSSLQTMFFITLGRLFDIDGDAFSVHTLLKSCIENLDQFSLASLRERKIRENGGKEPGWLYEYIKDAYQPVEKDFQRMRGEVAKRQKIYEKIYRPIRHQVYAHKEAGTIENVQELFGKTNIGQIEELIDFLHQIENVIFDVLYNGRMNEIGHYNFTEENRALSDVESLLGKLNA